MKGETPMQTDDSELRWEASMAEDIAENIEN